MSRRDLLRKPRLEPLAGYLLEAHPLEAVPDLLELRGVALADPDLEAWAVGELGVIVGSNRENAA